MAQLENASRTPIPEKGPPINWDVPFINWDKVGKGISNGSKLNNHDASAGKGLSAHDHHVDLNTKIPGYDK